MILAFHKQVIDNAQHLSGKYNSATFFFPLLVRTLWKNLFSFELFLVSDMAFAA
jgi:hypothetical protein